MVLIPKDVSIKRVCIAVGLEKNLLTVAMADPLLFSLVQDLEFQTGYRIKQVVATAAEILDAIQKSYPDKALAPSPCPRRPGSRCSRHAAEPPRPSRPPKRRWLAAPRTTSSSRSPG